jgi:hypothetical protein
MLYLFEYDDNEEAMIYSIFIFEILHLKKIIPYLLLKKYSDIY